MPRCRKQKDYQNKRTTHNGHSNGYNYTDKSIGTVTDPDGNHTSGWIIDCQDPGNEKCPGGSWLSSLCGCLGIGGDVDQPDADNAEDLIDYASDQIQQGTLTGTHTIQVQVAGESFTRYYKVSWDSTNTDGTTSTITVDRYDI